MSLINICFLQIGVLGQWIGQHCLECIQKLKKQKNSRLFESVAFLQLIPIKARINASRKARNAIAIFKMRKKYCRTVCILT